MTTSDWSGLRQALSAPSGDTSPVSNKSEHAKLMLKSNSRYFWTSREFHFHRKKEGTPPFLSQTISRYQQAAARACRGNSRQWPLSRWRRASSAALTRWKSPTAPSIWLLTSSTDGPKRNIDFPETHFANTQPASSLCSATNSAMSHPSVSSTLASAAPRSDHSRPAVFTKRNLSRIYQMGVKSYNSFVCPFAWIRRDPG